MSDTQSPPFFVLRRPSLPASLLAMVGLTAVWGAIRLFAFPSDIIPLTFVLPLMVCVWTRRTWQLIAMAVVFIAMAAFKTFYLLDQNELRTTGDWLFFGTTVVNVLIGVGVVQALLVFRNRIDDSRERILAQNAELEAQSEELAQQNEEIRAQGEELAQQNEEVESQAEELERQNGELQELNSRLVSRETVLQAIVESVNTSCTDARTDVLDEVCRRTLEVMGTAAEAVAMMELGDAALQLRASARVDTQPPLRATWPLEGSLAKVVLAEQRTAYVDDLHERPDLASPFFEHGSVRSILATPVRIGANQVGVLVVCARSVTHWTRDQFRLVEWVAAQCGMIFEGLRQRHELDRRTRELETANRAKDRFMAMLSHELRTPLTPVLAAAAALESDVRLPEDVREDVVMIRRNVGVQSRLIDDLLDLARVSNGKLHLHRENIALTDLLRQAGGIVACDLDARNMTLGLSIDLPNAAAVNGDSARLQQVIWNLLKNAIKFSDPGSRIQVIARSPGEGRVTIEVTDHGRGISAEDMERIFQPFEQAKTQATTAGLGLGLCIARAIVEQHGGRLWARSAGIGQGSTFTVELPLISLPHRPPSIDAGRFDPAVETFVPGGDRADEGAASAHVTVPAINDTAPRLLLVEDHADTAKVLKRLLMSLRYDVEHAASLAQARAIASERRFDLVVSDLGLPDGSGLDLIRSLRALDPQLSGICLSGFGMEADLAASREAGFVEHLVKPVDLSQLQAAIARALASRDLSLRA